MAVTSVTLHPTGCFGMHLLFAMAVLCLFNCPYVGAEMEFLENTTSLNQAHEFCQGFSKDTPWATLQCLQQETRYVLLRFQSIEGDMRWDRTLGVLIFLSFLGFATWSIKDIHSFISLLASDASKADDCWCEKTQDMPQSQEWPISSIIALTSYRFYTGFLNATWLPYLLAMEGQSLWQEKQSLFMGLAKLIYGASILMNPIFGLIGDQAVTISHGIGRKLFVRMGVTVAAIGIYICILSAKEEAFLSFLSGILVWRLGEALIDVTTEAIVPEMIPPSQYGIASSIKASSFLLGGLLGYVLLIICAKIKYSWLYFAYPIGMFGCAIPSLLMLGKELPTGNTRKHSKGTSFGSSLSQAYIAPMRFKGGFPLACMAAFIFSLGTSPMFFLLLLIRDLVGVTDPVQLQRTFSATSIFFFLSAAFSSVSSGLVVKRVLQSRNRTAQAQSDLESMLTRGRTLVVSMIVLAVTVLLIPCICWFPTRETRSRAFYILASCFGAAFGAAFSLFQDLTWQLLPPDVNFATAMGFNVMSRLLGIGLGNFVAGIILDLSYSEIGAAPEPGMVYRPVGYAIMCSCCFAATLGSSAVAYSAISAGRNEMEHLLSTKLAVPAA